MHYLGRTVLTKVSWFSVLASGSGKRFPILGVKKLILECWGGVGGTRKQGQAITRDIYKIQYQLYNSSRNTFVLPYWKSTWFYLFLVLGFFLNIPFSILVPLCKKLPPQVQLMIPIQVSIPKWYYMIITDDWYFNSFPDTFRNLETLKNKYSITNCWHQFPHEIFSNLD